MYEKQKLKYVISKLKTLLENYINVRHTGGNFVNKINVIKKTTTIMKVSAVL